jgi:hypothetical protein
VKRSLVAGALAAVLLAVPTTAARARSASCTRAVANRAIAQVKPRVAMLTTTPTLVTPSMADELICFDFTRDGRTDLAVTLASGGTAGDIGWLALVRTRIGWRLAHAQGGYKIGLFRVGGDIVDSQPIYDKKDPNCCPTGGFDHRRWHWNGLRFVEAPCLHTKSYRP